MRSTNNSQSKVFVETVYRDIIGEGNTVEEAMNSISSIQVICPSVIYCRYKCNEDA